MSEAVVDGSAPQVLTTATPQIFVRASGEHTLDTEVPEGVQMAVVEIVEEDDVVLTHRIRQHAGSRVHTVVVAPRGARVRIDLATDLLGAHAESELHALWIASGNAQTTMDVRVNHLVPDCRSHQLVKGVASGMAVGTFRGLVHVAPDAQRTTAMQQNRNLLMSEGARIFAQPQLEIYADDVKCSHGATVGQMDAEALYYMRQRGLSETAARRLQLHGFAADIVSRIADEKARERALTAVERAINEL